MTHEPLAFRVFNEVAIVEQLSRTLFERVMPDGLTLPQFGILNHFVRLGGEHSPSQLASAFQVTKQTMTSTLHRLERGGYVHIRRDPADGRGKIVSITPEGAAARQACVAAVAPLIETLSGVLEEAELADLLPRLTRLRQILDANRTLGMG